MNQLRRVSTIAILIFIITACAPAPTPASQSSPAPVLTATSSLSATTTPAKSPTPSPLTLVDPRDLQGQTVRFIHPWSGKFADDIAAIVADFNRTNLFEIQVEIIQAGSPSSLFDTVLRSLGQQDLPHLAVATLSQIKAWNQQIPVMVDLQPYIDDPEWGMKPEEVADLLPAYVQAFRMDQDQIGLPAIVDQNILFYNQTWAQELGFSKPPLIPEDFRIQACKAARANLERAKEERSYTGTGGWLIDNSSSVSLSWMSAFDASPLLSDGSLLFSSTRSAEAFTFLRELYDQDCAWFSLAPEPYEYFTRRQALFYSGTLADIMVQEYTNARLESPDDWMVLPYPSGETDPRVLPDASAYTLLAGEPGEQLAAWLVMRWLVQPRHHLVIIRNSASMPVHQSTIGDLAEFEVLHPQWAEAVGWQVADIAQRSSPEWLIADRLLEDFAWQIFQANVTTSEIPSFLDDLDDQLGSISR